MFGINKDHPDTYLLSLYFYRQSDVIVLGDLKLTFDKNYGTALTISYAD